MFCFKYALIVNTEEAERAPSRFGYLELPFTCLPAFKKNVQCFKQCFQLIFKNDVLRTDGIGNCKKKSLEGRGNQIFCRIAFYQAVF